VNVGEVDGELVTNDGIYDIDRPGKWVAGVDNIVGTLVSHAFGAAWVEHLD
jgi:TPP-dependent pyruvate/acetoin dehydrogenase alpha subunit